MTFPYHSNSLTVKPSAKISEPTVFFQHGFPGLTNDCPFIDLAKGSSWINTLKNSGNVDASGNLTGLTGTVAQGDYLFSARVTSADFLHDFSHMAGPLVVRYMDNGSGAGIGAYGSQVTVLTAPSTVAGIATGPRRYDTTARVQFNPIGNAGIRFTNFAGATPPSNVQIIPEQWVDLYDAGEIFNPNMIAMLDGVFKGVRFMWPSAVWGPHFDSITEMANWTKIEDQSWLNRWPVEIQCALAEKLNIIPHFCIPCTLSDTGMTDFANLANASLTAGRAKKIEFSNENWNPGVGLIQDALRALVLADYGISNATGSQMVDWSAKRSVEMCNLFDATDPNGWTFVLANWQNGGLGQNSSNASSLDAPIWFSLDPTNYQAPHAVHHEFQVTDYQGKPEPQAAYIMPTFDATFGRANADAAFKKLSEYDREVAAPDTRENLDEVMSFIGQPDYVTGAVRDIKVSLYEGGAPHDLPSGARFGYWFLPVYHQSGISVLAGDYMKGANGRVYKAATSGTTGATSPSHIGGTTVSDGAVDWQDFTHTVTRGTLNTLRDGGLTDEAPSKGCVGPFLNAATANIQPYANGTYTAGQYLEGSNGTIYKVTVGGTASAQPTHTTGTQATGGVTYEAVRIWLEERTMRPECARFLTKYRMSTEAADVITDMWEYAMSIGIIDPMLFTIDTIPSAGSFFGSFAHYADWGPTRTFERGDAIRNWCMRNPAV